jgi:hypothetical protein
MLVMAVSRADMSSTSSGASTLTSLLNCTMATWQDRGGGGEGYVEGRGHA